MPFCDECQRKFASNTTLKRHKNSFHKTHRTTFQCWHCHNVYARKENVIKHSLQKHNDSEGKFVIVETTNKKYKPDIFKPDPWTPPPEARTKNRGTTYQIRIGQTQKQKPPMDTLLTTYKQIVQELKHRQKIWAPRSTSDIDDHFKTKVTTEMLSEDLELSSSETSISSDDTICQDEHNNEETTIGVRVYNAFIRL